jgi:MarR family transcriptional repressor of emrRAB
VTHTHERQPANLLGALSIAVSERIAGAAAGATVHGASAPAALVALEAPEAGETIDALRRILGITHSGTVRLIDRLAGAGLVERRVGPDARSVSLSLTPTGRRTARRIMAAREATAEEVLSVLSPADRGRLADLLAELLAGLVWSADDARRVCRLCDLDACVHATRRCPSTQMRSTSTRP